MSGLVARRAMVRWALRLFRREWRQQLLVLALLTVAVAAGMFGEAAAFHMAPSRDAEFGSATFRMPLGLGDVPAARQWFGTIDVITHRMVPVPGSAQSLDVRGQDPDGPFGGPMLRLLAGRYPAAAGEVALTDKASEMVGAGLGDSAVIGGATATVVGLVENPANLGDEFALQATSDGAQTAVVLVGADRAGVEGFRLADGSRPRVDRRGDTEKGAAAVGGFGAATVLLLLISLVVAASFAVIAQRRLRQLGMLAAIGATPRQLRLVTLAGGAATGAAAAVVGALAGLAAWLVVAPRMENAVGHRIDRFELPWPVLGLGLLVAVAVATGAAWWPARAVSRVPVTAALSARMPRPTAVRRSAVTAAVLLATGFLCLAAGIDPVHDSATPVLVIGGIVATAGGLVFVSPGSIRALARLGHRAPVAVRLALRDLGRYQARSASALAAISLTLGITVTIVLLATASVHTAGEGNLSDRQLLFLLGGGAPALPEVAPTALQGMQSSVDGLASALGGAQVVPLDVAVDPAARESVKGEALTPIVTLGRVISPTSRRFVSVLYVATPAVLDHLGLAGRPVDPGIDVLTVHRGPLVYVNGPRGPTPAPRVEHVGGPSYSSLPTSLITAEGLRRAGWTTRPAGWLVESAAPLTSAQRKAARDSAAAAGLTVESRDPQRALGVLRTGATVGGGILALGVLALTVGLIRGEVAADLRALAAAGASGRVRRTITATTAAALGLLGVLLGTGAAYLSVLGGYSGKLRALGPVPVAHLLATIVGVPLAAAIAGWLLGGREPAGLSRPAFE